LKNINYSKQKHISIYADYEIAKDSLEIKKNDLSYIKIGIHGKSTCNKKKIEYEIVEYYNIYPSIKNARRVIYYQIDNNEYTLYEKRVNNTQYYYSMKMKIVITVEPLIFPLILEDGNGKEYIYII